MLQLSKALVNFEVNQPHLLEELNQNSKEVAVEPIQARTRNYGRAKTGTKK